ncbi:hypothetical protein FTO60_10990 [Octadecabacter sp. SW4]|uniref:DUF6476 family protein n=1 Tax=Octadecabacter sp. SW4 TaxID=2602067 RepID=UPI0011C20454|nr:DUF6476 family protein [Octadecabacter sp. SW4]QEE36188.1 hypothetical protein FTO60_10990 [Octadecabacter sp. SW4]|tara:strand:- start:1193 stop:1492 length:300 start_codon:yes stop_codon:yes gene_type:complete
MQDAPEETQLPASLKLLRGMVFVLTGVMILGFIVLIGLFVIRFGGDPVTLPDRVTLPAGTSATAFTQGSDWFAVVTDDDRILIYDQGTGALRQTITVDR